MRSRRKLLAAITAALAMLAGTVATASADPRPERPDPTPARATTAERLVQYAEAFDTVLDLSGAGKVIIDTDAGSLELWWDGVVPARAAALVANPPSGITARVEPADYSMAELDAAMTAAWEAAEQRGAEVATAQAANDLSGITLTVAESPVAARRAVRRDLVRAVARTSRVPVRVRALPYDPMPLSRADDAAPWQGGARMVVDGARCSTGFTVVKADGTGRILSAAHCDWSANAPVYDGGGDMIAGSGTYAVQNKKDWDSMLIDPTNGTIGLMYRGGINAPTSNADDVSGSANPVQGSAICVSGAASGEHCANMEIGQTGLHFACGPSNDRRECEGFVVKNVAGGIAASVGDSGAGAYVVKADGSLGARGIIVEGQTESATSCGQTVWGTAWCSSKFFAVNIKDLEAQWNVKVETR